MPDSVEVMVARIDERVKSMSDEICDKCKQIDDHGKRINRLESHDYAEIVLGSAAIAIMGLLIAAGYLHA